MSGLIIAAIIWGALALVVLLLFAYRIKVAAHEDDTLHVSHDTNLVAEQTVLAGRLGVLDKWGKILTVLAVVYGLIILGYYIATTMMDASRGI
ncbi:MAG: hypothetical protein GY953_03885 [bacterium]|nr:hypothetical protein [bacterium]